MWVSTTKAAYVMTWRENVVITYRPDFRDYRRKNRKQVRNYLFSDLSLYHLNYLICCPVLILLILAAWFSVLVPSFSYFHCPADCSLNVVFQNKQKPKTGVKRYEEVLSNEKYDNEYDNYCFRQEPTEVHKERPPQQIPGPLLV
jgi:hypothetical protein